MIHFKMIPILSLLILSVSCSSLVESTRRNLMGEESPRKAKKEVKWVAKAQYDDLLTKYKNLKDQYDRLKDEKVNSNSSYNQMDEMSENSKSQKISETIDVFSKDGLANKVQASQAPALKNLNQTDVSDELKVYKKGVALKQNGKADESLKVFQYLERSKSEQIRVRAKVHIGDIYMQNNQFDLALQVYEGVIGGYAFSGKVIPSLRNAIICCDQLGLKDKKLKYQSILRDFFEIEG
jgi:tetratricopeptide (TPR) repeat protein